jgi:hypothetical protein
VRSSRSTARARQLPWAGVSRQPARPSASSLFQPTPFAVPSLPPEPPPSSRLALNRSIDRRSISTLTAACLITSLAHPSLRSHALLPTPPDRSTARLSPVSLTPAERRWLSRAPSRRRPRRWRSYVLLYSCSVGRGDWLGWPTELALEVRLSRRHDLLPCLLAYLPLGRPLAHPLVSSPLLLRLMAGACQPAV